MIWQALERASSAELTTFLVAASACVFVYAFSDYFKIALLAMRLPGPFAVPLIGNCLVIKEKDLLTNRIHKAFKSYGSICRLWFTVYPVFIVFEPEYLQIILGSQKHTGKSRFYKLLHNFLGSGLITSSGEKWSSHRRYLQPTFHMSILEKFIATFADSAQCLQEKLRDQHEINITKFINECVLDILNEAVLGVPIKGDKSKVENSPFRQGKLAVQGRLAKPWLLFSFFYKLTETASEELDQKKRLDEFSMKMITKRREDKAKGIVPERKALLDYMIDVAEVNSEFTDDDIVNEACTFMLAGQDSVGATLALTIFMLAQHQDHQEKCIEELEGIFGSDSERVPTMNDLKEMKHLEMCIKETMRLYPAVPLIGRRLGEDIKVGKTTLPSGSEIFIIPYATHRLESVYSDPDSFIPERFSPENSEHRNPYAFLPFSAGPRNCIGYKFAYIEMKTVLCTILRSYRLLPVAGKTEIDPVFRITLRSRGGLWVRFEPRNNNVSVPSSKSNGIKVA